MFLRRLFCPETLLGLGLLCLLAFAGLNGSYALMVQWPWVLLWQGGFGLVALAMVVWVQASSGDVGSDRAGADRAGADRAGADRVGADRNQPDRADSDRTGSDRAGADRPNPDRPKPPNPLSPRILPLQPLGFGLDLAVSITALLVLLTSALALQAPPTLGYLVQFSGYGVVLYGVTHWLGDRPSDTAKPGGQPAGALPLGVQEMATYRLAEQDSSDRRWRLLQGLGVAGWLATLVGWWAWGMAQESLAEPINPFPLGDPDFGAGYLLLLLPLWAVLMTGRGNAWLRSGWAAIAGLGGGLLYTTGSPVGAVGIGALLLALFLLLLFAALAVPGGRPRPTLAPANSTASRERRLPLWAWSFGGLLLWGLAIVTHPRWPGWGQWAILFRDPWSWATGWAIWQDHRLWGIGLGNTALVYDAYRPLVATISSFREVALASTPLQMAVEMGLLGVALYGAWLGILVALWLRATLALDQAWELWRQQEASPGLLTPLAFGRTKLQGDRLLCRGCGASLLAYAWGSLLDFQLENLPISLTLVLITALLISLNQSYGGSIALRVDPWIRRLHAAPLVLLAVWLGLWFPVDGAMALARSGMAALGQGEVETFYDRWAAAAGRVPWDAYYDFQIGAQLTQYVERLNAQGLPEELPADAETIAQEREFREELLRKARRHLQYAVQKVPADLLFHRYLGFFLVDVDPQAAAPPLVRALQVAPRQPFLAAQLALAQGYLLPDPQAEDPRNPQATEAQAPEAAEPEPAATGEAASPKADRPEAASPDAVTGPDRSGESSPAKATDGTADPAPNSPAPESETPAFNPRQDLIQLTLALEGLVNPAFLLNDPAQLPELQPFWTGALEEVVDRYDRALTNLTATDPAYLPLLQNRTLLAWWLAQQQQAVFDWAALAPRDFLALSPRVRAIAAIDQNQAQAALDILQPDPSSAAALLRAWIAPERFLPELLAPGLLPPSLANQTDTLVRTLQEQREVAPWLLGLSGETRLQVQGLGFLFYRNTNGPDGVLLPDTVPLNYLVEALDLFAPVGESEAFDRVILETQGLMIQNLQGLGLLPQSQAAEPLQPAP